MTSTAASVLIEAAALAADRPAFTVLDASWLYPPLNPAGVDVRRRYLEAHIAGAVFLDLEALSPARAGVDDVPAIAPPGPEALRAALAAIGIGADRPLVLTDQDGGVSTAPFARLALLDAGFANVRLLHGGTPAWVAAGLPLTAAEARIIDAPRSGACRRRGRFVDNSATRRALATAGARVVDARMTPENEAVLPARYRGVAIPAHVVLRPHEVLLETTAGLEFRSPSHLQALGRARGLDTAATVITTCHFGLAAATVATALELAGLGCPHADADSLLGWATVSPAAGSAR